MSCTLTKLGKAIPAASFEEMKIFWKKLGHDIDVNDCPIAKMLSFSKSQLESQGKTTMAHVMVALGLFPSVKQAKSNGWNTPLTMGIHEVTKKKIKFEILN